MSQWCVESYPSSLYKFEIFSKLMFLAFWRNSGRDQGGPNPCLVVGVGGVGGGGGSGRAYM